MGESLILTLRAPDPLQTDAGHARPPPAGAALTRKQKRKLGTRPRRASSPRAAAGWVGRRARVPRPRLVRTFSPTPPGPAAKKRDEAPSGASPTRTSPGGPGGDGPAAGSFPLWRQQVGTHPPTAQTKFGRRGGSHFDALDRVQPQAARSRSPSPARVTCSCLGTAFPSVPRGEKNPQSAETRPRGLLGDAVCALFMIFLKKNSHSLKVFKLLQLFRILF